MESPSDSPSGSTDQLSSRVSARAGSHIVPGKLSGTGLTSTSIGSDANRKRRPSHQNICFGYKFTYRELAEPLYETSISFLSFKIQTIAPLARLLLLSVYQQLAAVVSREERTFYIYLVGTD